MKIYCGIVAGPNSSKLIKKLIDICEYLSNNEIHWLLMVDKISEITLKNTSTKLINKNDFSKLKKRKNITFDFFEINSPVIAGDRHGYGIDLIIKKLNEFKKIIILEPDSFPCCFNWDNIMLSKLSDENPIVVMCKKGELDSNLKYLNNNVKYKRTPCVGDIGFLCLKTNFFVNNNLTFMKINNFSNANLNQDLEKKFKKNSLYINNDELAKIFDVKLNETINKEFGWRIAYTMNKLNKKSYKFDTYVFDNSEHHSTDLIFNENNLMAIHLHYSRYITKELLKKYSKLINKILNHYKVDNKIKELFDNKFLGYLQ